MRNRIRFFIKKPYAFTLVELIVVITILAVLGTIGFVSLQGYAGSARDSVRVSDIANLEKAAEMYLIKSGALPNPDSSFSIEASGNILAEQGYAGGHILSLLGIGGGKDPVSNEYYTYITNASRTRYQFLGLLESESVARIPGIDLAYANSSFPVTKGSRLGVVMSGSLEPAQKFPMGTLDLAVTTMGSGYVLQFDSQDTSTSLAPSGYTGSLFTFVYNQREDLIKNKGLASLDPSLTGYWDMETLLLSGSVMVLKDFSANGHAGECYEFITPGDCGTNGPAMVSNGGKSGGYMQFDGADDHVRINPLVLSGSQDFTIFIKATPTQFAPTDWQAMFGDTWFRTFIGIRNGTARFEFATRDPYFAQSESLYEFGNFNNSYIVAGTINSSGQKRLYVDGDIKDAVELGAESLMPGAGALLCIGSLCDTSNMDYFNGSIDEVRVYNRALSEPEIQALTRSFQ